MTPRPCDLFFNLGSGTEADSRFDALKTALIAAGFEIKHAWKIGQDTEFDEALQQLAASPTEVTVVAGGDGTISGVTGTIIEQNKIMGVIPSGTFNYFARNRHIPEVMADAVTNLLSGQVQNIEVGKVNDTYFLNNASFGLYPQALKKREQHYKNWGRGRSIAMLSLVSTLLGKQVFYRTVLRTDEGDRPKVTPFVFVGANEFQLEAMGLRGHGCLEMQKLAIYVTECLSIRQRCWLALKAAMRRLEQAHEYRLTCAASLTVELRKHVINVAIDGEVRRLESPLEFSLVPKALKVIIPTMNRASKSL